MQPITLWFTDSSGVGRTLIEYKAILQGKRYGATKAFYHQEIGKDMFRFITRELTLDIYITQMLGLTLFY